MTRKQFLADAAQSIMDKHAASVDQCRMVSKKEREQASREARRRNKAPQWINDCVDYWSDQICESDIGVDWCDADIRCWRCGYLRACQKCHIVPKSLGGPDSVENIIPLCAQCHDEMPNVADKDAVWAWIRADHGGLYDSMWTMKAISIAKANGADIASFSEKRLAAACEKMSLHFGQLHGRARLSVQSLAWVIAESCKTDEVAK